MYYYILCLLLTTYSAISAVLDPNTSMINAINASSKDKDYKCSYLRQSKLFAITPELLKDCPSLNVARLLQKVDINNVETGLCILYYNNFENLCYLTNNATKQPVIGDSIPHGFTNDVDYVCKVLINNTHFVNNAKPGIVAITTRLQNACGRLCTNFDNEIKPICSLSAYFSYVTTLIENQNKEKLIKATTDNEKLTNNFTKSTVDLDVKSVAADLPKETIVAKDSNTNTSVSRSKLVSNQIIYTDKQSLSSSVVSSKKLNLPNSTLKTEIPYVEAKVIQKATNEDTLNTNVEPEVIQKAANEDTLNTNVQPEIIQKAANEDTLNTNVEPEVIQKGTKVGTLNTNVEPEVIHKEANEDTLNTNIATQILTKSEPELNPENVQNRNENITNNIAENRNKDKFKPTASVPIKLTNKTVSSETNFSPAQDFDGMAEQKIVEGLNKKEEEPSNGREGEVLVEDKGDDDIEIGEGIAPPVGLDYDNDVSPKSSEVKAKAEVIKSFEKLKPSQTDEERYTMSVNYQNQNIDDSDSYFFSYFMMFCVIFICGYVAYHNKQKILALVVEGRRGRRPSRSRRPNSANYRKLDSNLEEAVTSTCNKNTTQVIY